LVISNRKSHMSFRLVAKSATLNDREWCNGLILPLQPIFWISCFSIFRSLGLEFTTCQHPRISVTSYFQRSSKDILLSVILPHFSCPPSLEYLCPRALILLRLWRYINHVLTYFSEFGSFRGPLHKSS